MDRGKEVYRAIQVTDNVKTASLSIFDQLRLIVSKLFSDDSAELSANEKVSVERLSKIAGLTDFIQRAIDSMNKRGANSCMLSVSSTFLPYIEDVIGEGTEFAKFYDFEIRRENIPLSVKHNFLVKLSKKEGRRIS